MTPVEDIVAHGDEAREDNGISPVEMTLSHTFIQWNWSAVLRRGEGESCIGLKISRPSPCPETLVPSDYSRSNRGVLLLFGSATSHHYTIPFSK